MSAVFSRAGIAHFDQNTPKHPYLTFTLSGGLRRLVVKVWSHDQGHSSHSSGSENPFIDSHTWFALGAIHDAGGAHDAPCAPSDDELIEFQRNARAVGAVQCHINEWIIGSPASEDDDVSYVQFWLESLADSDGFKVGIFPRARYPGWVNTVWKMEVEVICSSFDEDPQLAPWMNTLTDENQRVYHSRLGTRHSASSSRLGEEALTQVGHQAIGATPQNDPHHANQLEHVGMVFVELFKTTGSLQTLNLGINIMRLVTENTPHGHYLQVRRSINYALSLGLRHESHGSRCMDDLNRAIDILEVALQTAPAFFNTQDAIDHGLILNQLGNFLGRRFAYDMSAQDIDRAIECLEMAIDITPKSHPDRGGRLNNLAAWLSERFQYKSSIHDIGRAIELMEEAIRSVPGNHPKYAGWLTNLANRLAARFERTGAIDDIHRAIQVAENSVKNTPLHHPQRPSRLNNLGNHLRIRFDRTHSMDDITHAINVVNQGIGATPQNHPTLEAALLANLGNCFGRLFQRSGSLDDINRSIESTSKSLGKTPIGHFDNIGRLDNLAVQLSLRHELTGSKEDIDRAVASLKVALHLAPTDHSHKIIMLSNLSLCLGMAYDRSHWPEDLDDAIEAIAAALGSVPEGHPNLGKYLLNLGTCLGVRSFRLDSAEDLDRAIAALTKAIHLTPEDHLDRAMQLNNLGDLLIRRSERNASMVDLDLASDALKEAATAIPADHYDRIKVFNNLFQCYRTRYLRTRSADDLESQLYYCLQGWNCKNSSPSTRMHLAEVAAEFLSGEERWEEASEILKSAVNLMPTLSPRALRNADRQHMISGVSGLASKAAATALNAGRSPEECLGLLEMGRGVMASLLLETRTEITELEQRHPDLAKRFESFRDDLDASPKSETGMIEIRVGNEEVHSWEMQALRRRELDKSFKEVIEEIRTKPGFERFLLAPEVQDLLGAASSGPIVVLNANHWRCDAFLITSNEIQLLPLPVLADAKIEGPLEVSSSLLERLWDNAAGPILERLGFSKRPEVGKWPRLFWILTGTLSRLPFHAAGYHYESSSETVLDRVVSSYSTSIRALLQSRQSSALKIGRNPSHEACLVSMRTTPSHSTFSPSDLNFAEQEIQRLESLLSPSVTTSLLSLPGKETVLRHIGSCTVFHFAGHGNTDPLDPSKSCLLLTDWAADPLTVESLTSLKLFDKPPWLAYLSACSTGENQAEWLQDESIHLVSACQLAGFPHVVGSLWKIDDECSAEAATEVYRTVQEHGWTDESVAVGVHNAARLLRSKTRAEGHDRGRGLDYAVRNEGDPSIWAAYIHVGP